jgi:molecular chaperone GrpE
MVKQDDLQQNNIDQDQEQTVDVDEGNEWREKAEEWENKYKRALADYQNLVKHSNEERREWARSSNRELLLRLLPVLDTLLLAQQHSTDQTLKVTVQQFFDVLKAEGVNRIETKDKMFDPHLMEVISVEDGDENKVVSEVRVGFVMHDKLLRPAQVIVGGKKENN